MTQKIGTWVVTVYMAGDFDRALQVIREYVYATGMCVTARRERYVYTGGEEDGFAIGFLNYPRFPSSPGDILGHARILVDKMLPALNQRSALIVSPGSTEWISVDPPGRRGGS